MDKITHETYTDVSFVLGNGDSKKISIPNSDSELGNQDVFDACVVMKNALGSMLVDGCAKIKGIALVDQTKTYYGLEA